MDDNTPDICPICGYIIGSNEERIDYCDRCLSRIRATAPDLLEACKEILSAISGMYIEFRDTEERVNAAEARVRAAIAKAEGREVRP